MKVYHRVIDCLTLLSLFYRSQCPYLLCLRPSSLPLLFHMKAVKTGTMWWSCWTALAYFYMVPYHHTTVFMLLLDVNLILPALDLFMGLIFTCLWHTESQQMKWYHHDQQFAALNAVCSHVVVPGVLVGRVRVCHQPHPPPCPCPHRHGSIQRQSLYRILNGLKHNT